MQTKNQKKMEKYDHFILPKIYAEFTTAKGVQFIALIDGGYWFDLFSSRPNEYTRTK
jgi:hypothetical protein